jgi:hypothetical protein
LNSPHPNSTDSIAPPKNKRTAATRDFLFQRLMVGVAEINVQLIRVNDGAARTKHETCLGKTPDPMLGRAWGRFPFQAPDGVNCQAGEPVARHATLAPHNKEPPCRSSPIKTGRIE